MWHLWRTITQIKEIEGIAKSLKNRFNQSVAHHCENYCLTKIFSSYPIPHISSVYEMITTRRQRSTPRLPLKQLFLNPCLAHPPLSELWLFGCGMSNLGQLKTPQRKETERESCTHTQLCRAQIGWKKMAPHWMLPSVCGHLQKKKKKKHHSFFPLFIISSDSNRVKCHFTSKCQLLQPALISQTRGAASPIEEISAVWRRGTVRADEGRGGLKVVLRTARSGIVRESAYK